MVDISFNHGVRVFENNETPVLIRVDQSAVVGIIGTAEDADATAFPLNTPVQVLGKPTEIAKLGDAGSLKDAIDTIFDQIYCPVIVVRVTEGADTAATWSNIVGDVTTQTGIHAFEKCEALGLYKPRLLLAPGWTSTTPNDGVLSVALTAAGTGYPTTEGAVRVTSSGDGDGFKATPVVNSDGTIASITIDTPGFGYSTAPTLTIEGGGTGATATAITDGDTITDVVVTNQGAFYSGTVSVAFSGGGGTGAAATATVTEGKITAIDVTSPGSGYTSAPTVTLTNSVGTGGAATAYLGNAANPVVAEAAGVAEKLGAIFYADGPDTTDAAAVQYKNVNSFPRVFICDPKVLKWDTGTDAYVAQPSSPVFVGDQARTDKEFGFHHAGSNHIVNGIGGVNRPIALGIQSNYLNENRVNTIVNYDGGFRTWGVWLSGGSSLWQFVSVRRVADMVNEAIEKAYREFVDKPFSKANLKFMVESGNAFLRSLAQQGYILPGAKCWIDPEKNTDAEMAQGIIRLSVRFEPPAPMVQIDIEAYRWIASYTLLLDQVVREIESGSLAAA
jgi:hypothetical protein